MTELNSRFQPVRSMFTGLSADADSLHGSIKPVRYRYVMAYLQETVDSEGVTHQPGEVMAVLPMTSVTYSGGFYSGTEMSGAIYLPEMWLDLMSHQPLNDYDRRVHPDQSGVPVGAMFECGNRALYVMRNEDVVWGGILWTRQYTSGTPTLQITGLSWDGYAYYRALRKSIVFLTKTSVYNIWRTVLNQMLNDFTLTGATDGVIKDGKRQLSTRVVQWVEWTGLTRDGHFNAAALAGAESWKYNSPDIELPPANLVWKTGTPATEVKTTDKSSFRGYDMNKVGEALQQWADTETLASSTAAGAKTRFEYRVVCWFDTVNQRFRQRYVFGEMTYAADGTPTGITSGLMGKNTQAIVDSDDNALIFDFPGHISEWSLGESMEEAATRVIMAGGGEAAVKHVQYASEKGLLKVPTAKPPAVGSRGWRLYDRIVSAEAQTPSVLQGYANKVLANCHVPQAMQISSIDAGSTQRASYRSTDLSVTLYTDPTTPFPEWGIGDWATFAIEDPFYGGKMYLKRRIIGYTVTVVPEQESDYSHEQISLDLTDETKISEGS